MNKEITHINNVILISINDIGSSTKIENTNFFKNIYTFYFEDIEDEYVYSIYSDLLLIPHPILKDEASLRGSLLI